MAEATSMDAILKLITSLSGKGAVTTTSGGNTTQQTELSQDTINATLKSALEGNQGLAQLAAGQNNSGMYNSTTNQQLSNDLLARLTTEAAVKGAPTTRTLTPTTQTITNPGSTQGLLSAGALALGKKGIDKLFAGDLFGASVGDTAIADSGIGAILEGHGGMDAAFNMAGNAVSDAWSGISSEASSSLGGNILDMFVGGGGSVSSELSGSALESVAETGGSWWDSVTDWFGW